MSGLDDSGLTKKLAGFILWSGLTPISGYFMHKNLGTPLIGQRNHRYTQINTDYLCPSVLIGGYEVFLTYFLILPQTPRQGKNKRGRPRHSLVRIIHKLEVLLLCHSHPCFHRGKLVPAKAGSGNPEGHR